MNCPKCQSIIPDNAKFCSECGANISSISKQSGQESDISIGDLRTMVGADAKPAMLSVGEMRTMIADTGKGQDNEIVALIGDRYEIIEKLGQGGFAVVYKARDRKLDRLVAIKRLLADKLQGVSGQQTLERFRREAQTIAKLNHRNIVNVYDHDQDADGYYIVIEYVDGGNLMDYLKAQGGKLPVVEAVRLVKGIVKGLAYAHRKNLVHRDIKPTNILIGKEEEQVIPKIVDFGLARLGTESELSRSGYGMGTPYYMPPEQRRDAKNVNHTADIYALGKTLYELVTGEIPDNVDPQAVPPPPELSRIILKCVRSNPEDRYFSADELTEDLEGVEQQIGMKPARVLHKKGGANSCPSCGEENAPEVKFCESCGVGMTRLCPECERENSVNKQYCGGCGIDVDVFLRMKDAFAKIEQYAKEHQYSRVLKEAQLPEVARFAPRGEKGKALVYGINRLKEEAEAAGNRVKQLPGLIKSVLEEENAKDAKKLIEEYSNLAKPPAEELEKLMEQAQVVEIMVECREIQGRVEQFFECKNLDLAKDALNQALDKNILERLSEKNKRLLSPVFQELDRLRNELAKKYALKAELEGKERHRRKRNRTIIGIGIVLLVAGIMIWRGCWMLKKDQRTRIEWKQTEEQQRERERQQRMAQKQAKVSVAQPSPSPAPIDASKTPSVAPVSVVGPQAGLNWTVPDFGMEFVWIPLLNGWVGKYEVTNEEYRKYKPDHNSGEFKGYSLNGNRQPVVEVSYNDTVAFAEWLTKRERQAGRLPDGYQYRLPDGDEWMKFAKYGDGREYPWGNEWLPKYGNYVDETFGKVFGSDYIMSGYDDGYAVACPVEKSGKNDWGLYGVAGNVFEWTTEPEGAYRILRSASWNVGGVGFARCSNREKSAPSDHNFSLGFRLMLLR